jgi:hypothetical protein
VLNQLLKVGLFVTMGLWLKHRLRGLACLLAVLVITWVLHGEYLAYVERSGNTEYLEWSFVIKWAVLFVGVGLYYLLVEWRIGNRFRDNNKTRVPTETVQPVGDGFDFLRQKKSLDSEADMTLKAPGKPRD